MARQRLHKVLAAAGLGSRRACEELILEGHVTVDGSEIRTLGLLVDPETQDIRYHEDKIRLEKPAYFVVNKPSGFICTNNDPQGRRTVISLIRDRSRRRLYTVGRLDEGSEGLILVTNDGEFANHVAHPRYGVDKTYELKLRGYLTTEALDRVRKGVWLSTGKTQSMYVKLIKRSKQFSHVSIVIHEGKNRQLRRVFAKVGHPVMRLQRTRVGTLTLSGLKKGHSRQLTPDEVTALLERCEKNRGDESRRPKKRSSHSERWPGEKAEPRKRASRRGGPRRRR